MSKYKQEIGTLNVFLAPHYLTACSKSCQHLYHMPFCYPRPQSTTLWRKCAVFLGTFALQKLFPPSKSKLLTRDVGLYNTTQLVYAPTHAMPRQSSRTWSSNQHIPHILSKCGTEHYAASNGGSSNPFTSASLGTNWIKVMLFGFSLPGRRGTQRAPCQQGSVVSASILDQHSAYLHLLDYERSARGKVASWEKKDIAHFLASVLNGEQRI